MLDSSDPVTSKRNRETFVVAFAEEWRIEDLSTGHKELVIGHESWPFPVPLVKTPRGWVFDVAAGKEEVLNRRIGRNELTTIETCLAIVKAQRAYAGAGHDGKPAGIYAQRFSSRAVPWGISSRRPQGTDSRAIRRTRVRRRFTVTTSASSMGRVPRPLAAPGTTSSTGR